MVNRGESVGIVGKNGSGKTTLLQLISGISDPTAGSLEVNGKIAALLELGAGFDPEFTGRQNIHLNAAILGLNRNEIEERFDTITAFADIGEFIDQPIKTYSSGMVVRLAFSVAIHVKPDIFVVDEALAVGDDLFKRKCYAKIQTFLEEGNTLLFVSHSLDIINEICDRAILIDKGELILDGASKMVTNQYQRYLFTAPSKLESVRDDIIKLNNEPTRKKDLENELVSTMENNEPSSDPPENKRETVTIYRPEYLANLQSKSRIEYKNAEVAIYDIYLKTIDGQRVNRLLMGEKYIYSYKVKFGIPCVNIVFGMMVTNDRGIQISGRNTPDDSEDPIPFVENGTQYQVEWHFQCNLLPNLYYLNIGVSSEVDGERIFLNRIVDALVFDVKKNNNLKYVGIVDLCQCAKVAKLPS